jgi:hypothetical protein
MLSEQKIIIKISKQLSTENRTLINTNFPKNQVVGKGKLFLLQ